jgi:hypothetical protein
VKRVSSTCARIVASTPFDIVLFGVIVANAIVLGLETYDSIGRDAAGCSTRSQPARHREALRVMGITLLYVYGMVGWLIVCDHYPDECGTIGEAMLTLFVLLSLETLISFVLIAAFLLLNILIGVVINSLRDLREALDDLERELHAMRR